MANHQWDIFCKVIDNFGDIGVSWRLAADLAARGQRVRLWVDDTSALAWMAPEGCAGVTVMRWADLVNVTCLETAPCDVLVEAFGCDVAPEFIANCARICSPGSQVNVSKPLWINLEYLSAEPFVGRNHGLTSLISSGPAAGWRKVFYYPGFTPETGGLLREPDLLQRRMVFDRCAWLRQQGIDWRGEILVSLFCYEPAAMAGLINDLERNGIDGQPVRLLVAAGRATNVIKSVLGEKILRNINKIKLQPNEFHCKPLLISYLPLLTQTEFDHLLWASDINFVRGEDSMVRAIWAGKPFIWEIYPQYDGAHRAKLEAFLDMLGAPPTVRAFHRVWNGLADEALPSLKDTPAWQATAGQAQIQLAEQRDLTTGLIEYALKNR